MKNDQLTNILLIESVERCPELWDCNHEKYSNKQYADVQWQEVAKIMNASAKKCRERWNNIRGCYSRHLRTSQNDSSGKHTKEYYLAPFLSFLMPFMKSRFADGDIPRPPEAYVLHANHKQQEPTGHNKMDLTGKRKQPIPITKGGKETDHFEEARVDYVTFKKCKSDPTQLDDDNEADRNFLLSLLPDMAKLTGRKKNQFKLQVIQVMDKLRYDDNVESQDGQSNVLYPSVTLHFDNPGCDNND